MDPKRPERRPSLAHLVGSRGRNVLHVASWSLIAKVAAAANLFLPVPFVITALGQTQFGAWATLVSFTTFAAFLDFGLGNGTMNVVAAALGRGSTAEISAAVHEGRRTLMRVAAMMTLLAACAVPLVPWHTLLGLPATMEQTSRAACAIVIFSIIAAIPLNLAGRVQLGLGRGDRTFRWQALGQLVSLALLLFLARGHASLPTLTAAAVFSPLSGAIVNTLLLSREPAWGKGKYSRHPEVARRIRREGLLFFALQMAVALAFSADLPLISALRGAGDAGTYAIVQRLFSVVPLVLGLVWTPLWPIYRRALVTKDHAWIRRTLSRSILMAVGVSASASLLFFVAFDRIMLAWLHRPLVVGQLLVAGFAVWAVLDGLGGAIGTFFNAASLLRYQVIVATLFALACFTAKALVIASIGISFAPWAAIATYCTISLLPTWLLWPKLKRAVFEKAY